MISTSYYWGAVVRYLCIVYGQMQRLQLYRKFDFDSRPVAGFAQQCKFTIYQSYLLLHSTYAVVARPAFRSSKADTVVSDT